MPRKKNYSDEIKEQARARVAAGDSLSRVARELGVAKSTLHSWLTQADRDGHQQARESQKQRFIRQAWESVFRAVAVGDKRMSFLLENADRIDEAVETVMNSDEFTGREKADILKILGSLASISLKDLAIYAGTLYDKIALASGEPTSRVHEDHKTEDVTFKELLKNAPENERTEFIRIVRNAAFPGDKDTGGNGPADLGDAASQNRFKALSDK